MKQIDHIGVAVNDLSVADALYTRLLGVAPTFHESVSSQHLEVSFFEIGSTKVELLMPTDERSTIHKFLQNKGEGIHHVAFEVEDILTEMKRLKEQGFSLLSNEPLRGANHKWVCFVHPKTAGGVLVEICQKIKEDHA